MTRLTVSILLISIVSLGGCTLHDPKVAGRAENDMLRFSAASYVPSVKPQYR